MKERSKELFIRGAGREPPLCLPRFYSFVSAFFCGVGYFSSASSRCKERSKELFIRGAGREPPLRLPRFYSFVSAVFCGIGNESSAFSPCKKEAKNFYVAGRGASRPFVSRDFTVLCPRFFAVSETQARLLLFERKKQRTFTPRSGARAAPSSPAILLFCVRVFLRCRIFKRGFFSLKERSKELFIRGAGREPPLHF